MVKDDNLPHDQGPEDHSGMADEYPSPEASNADLVDPMDMSTQLAAQAAAQAQAQAQVQTFTSVSPPPQDATDNGPGPGPSAERHSGTPEPRNTMAERYRPLSSNVEQIKLLRDFYARNPNPSKRDLELLAERTGRHYTKVREYFRQRRNKLRGLGELEKMEEPGRASGWLRISYRAGPSTSHVPQLSLYHAYKTRFDPYSAASPLLGGQDLIELVCATFPGCEMSKVGEDYHLTGLKEREGGDSDWEKTLEGVAEPVRAASWLLSTYQQTPDATPIPQTDLYTSYALRFSAPTNDNQDEPTSSTKAQQQSLNSLHQADDSFELADLDGQNNLDPDVEQPASIVHHRLLNPVELITLTRMTFPQCEPAVDDAGKFIIRGLERREGVEKGWADKSQDMFPFALLNEPRPTDPDHPLTNLLKRKLASLNPDAPPEAAKRARPGFNAEKGDLAPEDKELLEGLRRFKHSDLGKEVRDICVNQ